MSRIAAIEAVPLRISPKTIWTFVAVADSDGKIGIGEATLNAREADVVAEVARLSPYLVNRPAEPAPLEVPVPHGGQVEASVSSALDQALWDLKGQREGKPVWQLLGPTQRKLVPLYANINRRTVDRRPEGFAASARHAAGVGFTRFKVAPFDNLTPEIAEGEEGRPLIEAGIARIAAVREAAGPAARVMVDCHWRFTEASAERAIERLAELDVDWFECPIAEGTSTIPAIARLRKRANAAGMELAGLEMSTSPAELMPYLEAGCYDVVMPDIKYIGGFAGMLQAGTLCKRYNVGCAPHNPTGPFCHAASLHASAVLDGFDLLEHQYDESPLFDQLVNGRLPNHARDASELPTASGLGISLNPDLLGELRV